MTTLSMLFPLVRLAQFARYATMSVLAGSLVLSAHGQSQPSASAAFLSGLPMFFEPDLNDGGMASRFIARTRSGMITLTAEDACISLAKLEAPALINRSAGIRYRTSSPVEMSQIQMRFLGVDPAARIVGGAASSGRANYLMGRTSSDWRTNLPLFTNVRVQGIYLGIDLVYYGNQELLEYDFIVAPHASPSAISFRISGGEKVLIDPAGNLVIQSAAGRLSQHKPIIYQVINGRRQAVPGGYRLIGGDTVGFEVGQFDPSLPLVLDPFLTYATYLGGSHFDSAYGVALDSQGNIYVAGETLSANFPVSTNAFSTNYHGAYFYGDAFVAKFDATGSNLVYVSYLGGSGDDAALGIVVDSLGAAILTGVTDSTNFPLVAPIQSTLKGLGATFSGIRPYDAFITKLSPSGSQLVFSTYLGGDQTDEGIGIALDALGDIYLTGYTTSTNFPTVAPLQPQMAGLANAFVTKMKGDGSALVYSTYLGGTNQDQGSSIAVDSRGRAVVCGATRSSDFPTTPNAFQPLLAAGADVFLSVLSPSGANLEMSTFFGGGLDDIGYRVALDGKGNAFVTGAEGSTTFAAQDFPISPGNINPGGVFRSVDAAASWSVASQGLLQPSVFAVAIDPVNPSRVYAGTGRGLARSANFGLSWDTFLNAPSSYGQAPLLAVSRVDVVAVDPQQPSTVYAGTLSGLYKSTDYGTNWSFSSTGLVGTVYGPLVSSLAIDPVNSSDLFAGTFAGVYKSTNGAASWVAVNNGLANPYVADVAIAQSTPTTLFAATEGGGVFRTTDGGFSWLTFNSGLSNLVVLRLAIHPQTPLVVYAGTTNGLYKSSDGGTNWTFLSFGPNYTNVPITALKIDPFTPEVVYVGTFTGVLKSRDAGLTWTQSNAGLSVPGVYALAISPGGDGSIYAGSVGAPSISFSDAFLTKFNLDTGALIFSSFLGASGTNQGWSVVVDSAGNPYVAGGTSSTNFPAWRNLGSSTATNSGGFDAFVTAVTPDGTDLPFSFYLGGSGNDVAQGVAIDSEGSLYVVGSTASTNFPVIRAVQPQLGGTVDAFLVKIRQLGPQLLVNPVGGSVEIRWRPSSLDYVLQVTGNLQPPVVWNSVPQTPVLNQGFFTVTLGLTNSQAAFRLARP